MISTYKELGGGAVHVEAMMRTKPESWKYRVNVVWERKSSVASCGRGDGAGWEGTGEAGDKLRRVPKG